MSEAPRPVAGLLGNNEPQSATPHPHDRLAQKFYGNTTPSAGGAAAGSETQRRDTALDDFERDKAAARRMYSAVSTYGNVFDAGMVRLRDEGNLTREEAEADRREIAEYFSEWGVPGIAADRLYSELVAYRLRPPDAETISKWTIETRKNLRERYGDKVEERLADYRAYLEANPKVLDRLAYTTGQKTGLANKWEVASILVEHAHRTMNARKR